MILKGRQFRVVFPSIFISLYFSVQILNAEKYFFPGIADL